MDGWIWTMIEGQRRWSLMAGLLCLHMIAQADLAMAQPPIPPAPDAIPRSGSPATVSLALLEDRPIQQLRASIAMPTPLAPENVAQSVMQTYERQYQLFGQSRDWCLQPLQWDASAVRHLPTYFEEPNLERLGYYYGIPKDGRVCGHWLGTETACYWLNPYAQDQCLTADERLITDPPRTQLLQPAVSALNFYGRVAAIPYMLGAQDPTGEVYSLGEDRPGSPVPYRKHYIPLSLRGALYQGSAVTGLGYLIP